MSVLSLTPPADITWTRMAYSRDMVDTDFGDGRFGPKWRSSLAVYYYLVPLEDTADDYPNDRVVYLKLTCSITGYNPSEELAGAKRIAESSGALDDLQRSTWEVITGSGWAAKYWPCLGAIMQLAVYPSDAASVDTDEYPYIVDFEPKKRELYEAVTEGSEVLSGTQGKTQVTKGSTSVETTEVGGSVGFAIGPFGASGSINHSSSDTNVNQKTTDTSREARETLSRTTQSSQMYQLFNGYHLGSNRAMFVVAPRPHTVSGQAQTDFNLIDGARKLEGIQEVFLVVQMPKDLAGFCIQAGLDTGHQVSTLVPYQAMMARPVDDGEPQPGGDLDPPPPPDPPEPPPWKPIRQIVVTRRVVQACGTFDANGLLQLERLAEPRRRPPVVGEFAIVDEVRAKAIARMASNASPSVRVAAADALNAAQSRVSRLLMDRTTALDTEPIELHETAAFRSLAANAARVDTRTIEQLVDAGHLSVEELQQLERRKITTISELFAAEMSPEDSAATAAVRRRVIANLLPVPADR